MPVWCAMDTVLDELFRLYWEVIILGSLIFYKKR